MIKYTKSADSYSLGEYMELYDEKILLKLNFLQIMHSNMWNLNGNY